MSTATKQTETRALDAIVPYWRNPRDIPSEAIDAVAESIERYGYISPIVIEEDGTIIAGHTRYAALRRLGEDEAEVIVVDGLSPQEVKELRILDNRTSDYTKWDTDALALELREWETDLLERFFPDVDLQVGEIDTTTQYTAEAIEEAAEAAADVGQQFEREVATITCPHCFESFDVDETTI